MNAGPVILRELRAEARRPVNYWLRVLAAGAVIGVAVATVMLNWRLPPAFLGGYLFAELHTTLVVTFLVVVPLMTADCVSQERREGTLGLLFLTPLSAFDIIAGKSLVHLVRAVTLFLAAIPVLTLPFLLGGVGWRDAATAVMFEACAVLLGAAAGLLATSKGGTATQVTVLAEVYVVILAFFFLLALHSLAAVPITLTTRTFVMPGPAIPRRFFFVGSVVTPPGYLMGWSNWFGVVTGPWRAPLQTPEEMLLLCLLVLTLAISTSVRRLSRTWHEESAAPEQPRWVKLFSNSDFWQTVFRWNKSRTLDRNPIAWLQEYSWTARLTKWGWCLVLLFVELDQMTNWNHPDYLNRQTWVTLGLVLGVAFSAVNSFRRERQTGLLELLLVTPLSPRQLIGGRLWGVGCHFFPAAAVLMVGWVGDWILGGAWFLTPVRSISSPLLVILSTFGALAVIGLSCSLWRVPVLVAWITTVSLGLMLPWLLVMSLHHFVWVEDPLGRHVGDVMLFGGFQIALAALAGVALYRDLARRKFALHRTPV